MAAGPTGSRSSARLTAAVLSTQDLPTDFLPADDQEVFRGVGPGDPSCRRLLDLVDLRGLRDVPESHSVFYRINPGSTLAEHVVGLGASGSRDYLGDVRKAAASCPVMRIPSSRLRLHRRRLPAPEGALGLRYTGWTDDNHVVTFDMVIAPVGDRLMVMAQPSLADQRRRPSVLATGRLAATAVRKLQATP
jgi:hypothetical protein